ncbi:MAG: hypothetical protein M1829_005400 [Trizodia sp. TS-e1964]|nr:MAG: hypothetical protein M1829_005400 [Trizodia sp. TS-e1964]
MHPHAILTSLLCALSLSSAAALYRDLDRRNDSLDTPEPPRTSSLCYQFFVRCHRSGTWPEGEDQYSIITEACWPYATEEMRKVKNDSYLRCPKKIYTGILASIWPEVSDETYASIARPLNGSTSDLLSRFLDPTLELHAVNYFRQKLAMFIPQPPSSASSSLKPSMLESLPIEILSEIFVSSLNPSLPLASRTLLTTLSTSRNQHQLALNMLASPCSNVHSDLLRRRFLTFDLYHTLTWKMDKDCDDDTFLTHQCAYRDALVDYGAKDPDILERAAHFFHPFGTVPPERLFHNFLPNTPPQSKQFWKIKLLRRLCYASVDFSDLFDEYSVLLSTPAQDGLIEARMNRNVDAIEFFVECQFDYDGSFCVVDNDSLMYEVIAMDCDSVDITYYIIKYLVSYSPSPWVRPSGFMSWIRERKERDRKARAEWKLVRRSVGKIKEQEEEGDEEEEEEEDQEDEISTAIANHLLVGHWLEFFPEHKKTYDQYVRMFYRRRLYLEY